MTDMQKAWMKLGSLACSQTDNFYYFVWYPYDWPKIREAIHNDDFSGL